MTEQSETIDVLRLNLKTFLKKGKISILDLQVLEEEVLTNPFSKKRFHPKSTAIINYVVLKPGASIQKFMTKTIIANKKTMTEIGFVQEPRAHVTLPHGLKENAKTMDMYWLTSKFNGHEEFILAIIPEKVPFMTKMKHVFKAN